MNDRQARAKGYAFTGYFGWDKEEMKVRAAQLRKDGNKALVVTEPGSRRTGYSVFWIQSEAGKVAEAQAALTAKIANLKAEKAQLKVRIAEINTQLIEEGAF